MQRGYEGVRGWYLEMRRLREELCMRWFGMANRDRSKEYVLFTCRACGRQFATPKWQVGQRKLRRETEPCPDCGAKWVIEE